MRTVRRIVLVLVAIVMATGVWFAFRPYNSTMTLNTPAGVKTQVVNFSCGPLLGSDYTHGPPTTLYSYTGAPCAYRQQYQIMDIADLAEGALVVGVLLVWPWRRRHADSGAVAPAA